MFSRSMSGALLLGLFGALVPAAPVEGGARWDVRTPDSLGFRMCL